MRSHAIATFVAAALSFGHGSALGAQKPSKPDTTKGGYAGPGAPSPDVLQLTAMVDALRKRVSALESYVAKLEPSTGSTPKMAAKFQAPFTVVDENGKMIFTVSDDDYSSSFRGRVHVGRGSGGNYNIWFHNAAGAMMATMGESRTGSGLVAILKGNQEIGSMDEDGFTFMNTAGKQITHLGPDPTVKSRGRLVVRGTLHITDEKGNTTVDAGTLNSGAGAVRTWPNSDCKTFAGLRSPTCLMGQSP